MPKIYLLYVLIFSEHCKRYSLHYPTGKYPLQISHLGCLVLNVTTYYDYDIDLLVQPNSKGKALQILESLFANKHVIIMSHKWICNIKSLHASSEYFNLKC